MGKTGYNDSRGLLRGCGDTSVIVFAHLLNDRSGSPKVLASTIACFQASGREVRLFVGSEGAGCLNDVGVTTTRYWYRRTPYRFFTLATYLASQFLLLLRLHRTPDIDRSALIYVNTLLPVGASLYGWMTGRPVVYHLHEVSVSPVAFKWFLVFIARLTARRLIYVSDFHRRNLPISFVSAKTVYNALDETFMVRAGGEPYQHRHDDYFNVLMLASLRNYKGIPEFLALAGRLATRTDIRFNLVLNDDTAAVERYFQETLLSSNVTVYPRTDNTKVHYAKASLVLNLSRPDLYVETFGMTLLEAMAFGIPVIAPTVGGPLELVSDGQEGFLIDCRNGEELVAKVLQLADDEALCLNLSGRARQRAAHFTSETFARGLHDAVAFPISEEYIS